MIKAADATKKRGHEAFNELCWNCASAELETLDAAVAWLSTLKDFPGVAAIRAKLDRRYADEAEAGSELAEEVRVFVKRRAEQIGRAHV